MDAVAVTPPLVARPFRLAPFRAVRLAPSRIGDPSSARLLARPYADAGDRIERWRRRGLLEHDPTPALYLHEYSDGGLTVRGLVGALDVSSRATRPEDRAVLPHEGIYPSRADALADRMAQLRINPAPILLLQSSPPELRRLLARVRDEGAGRHYGDADGHTHAVWVIDRPDDLDTVARLLASTSATIADGHHRYAAYLRLQQRAPGGAADRGLAMLVDQIDTPFFLGAIHRVLAGCSVRDVESAARVLNISTRRTSRGDALDSLSPGTAIVTDCDSWIVVDARSQAGLVEVEVIHDQLIPTLGRGPARIDYHHTAHQALDHAAASSGVAVLLPALTADAVERVVRSNRLLPEKATSFQPKPPFGSFLRSWRDEPASPTTPPPPPGTPHPHQS